VELSDRNRLHEIRNAGSHTFPTEIIRHRKGSLFGVPDREKQPQPWKLMPHDSGHSITLPCLSCSDLPGSFCAAFTVQTMPGAPLAIKNKTGAHCDTI
jgi:hypothetical protein